MSRDGIAEIKEEPDEEQEELPKAYIGKTRKTAADHRRCTYFRHTGINFRGAQRTETFMPISEYGPAPCRYCQNQGGAG